MIDMIGGVAGRAIGNIIEQSLDSAQGGSAVSGGQSTGASFADTLMNMGNDVITNLKDAEVQSFKAVSGEADTREVVDALMSAEQSLQTAIAIRDKLVTAYLEIARMQI